MTEIIYLDIDGTLRDEREGIPESVVWALNECRKNKIQIVICTGRNQTSIQDDVMKLPWDSREPDGVDGLVKCTSAARNQPGIGEFLQELKEKTFDRHECVTVAEVAGVSYDELDQFMGENGYFSMIFDFRYADLDVASGSEWFKRIDWSVKDLNEKIITSQMAIQKYG